MKNKDQYIAIVNHIAECSKDSRLKVGAIVLRDNRIIATGYNGQPSGWPHEPVIHEGHDVSTVHAEQNCVALCARHGISLDGCEVLVTHFPCHACTKLLIQAGVQRVYYINEYHNDDNPFNMLTINDGGPFQDRPFFVKVEVTK
jgi:dCMP deaminase